MKTRLLFIFMMSFLSLTAMGQKKIALLEPRVGEGSTGVSGMEKAMVRGELRKAIVNNTGYEAFTRADIDKLMSEQDFQRSGMVSDDQIRRIGDMSGADYICVSTLNKTNAEFYLEAYLVDVETAQISNPASQYGELVGGKLANMLPVCQALAQELLGTISPAVSSIYPASATKPAPREYSQLPATSPEVTLDPKIGTLKDFPDGSRGIIFYVDDKVGLAVSLDMASLAWHSARRKKDAVDVAQIANNENDDKNFIPGSGLRNTRAIITEIGSGGAPAAAWCTSHGEGWYLPTAGELVYLFKKANDSKSGNLIDKALNRMGLESLDGGWYWSSSECDKMEAINVSSGGRASGEEKENPENVRAVRMFNLK